MTLASIVSLAAQKAGISATLLLSVCQVETGLRNVNNFQDRNHSSLGVCQVQLPTAREILPWVDMLALQQPVVNAHIAARVLKQKIKKYGEMLGIAAYNSGSPKFKDGKLRNNSYVDKVEKVRYNILYGEEKTSQKICEEKSQNSCLYRR